MQRRESVTSDPRKALSRCLGQEEGGQAGTTVTLKLAQPLHMPQEATASTRLPQLYMGTLSWLPSFTCLGQLGIWGLLPSTLEQQRHWSVFSVLLNEPDPSINKDAFCSLGELSTGVKVDPSWHKAHSGVTVKATQA